MWNLCNAEEFLSFEIIIVSSELTISFFTEIFIKWLPPPTTTFPLLFLSSQAQTSESGNRRWGTTSSPSASGASQLGAPGSTRPVEVVANAPTQAEAAAQAAWDENLEQVQGIIGSHILQTLHPHIGTMCAQTWTNLRTRFSTPGVSEIAANMYTAYSMKLLTTHNPHPDMGRMNTLFEQLNVNSMAFSDAQ